MFKSRRVCALFAGSLLVLSACKKSAPANVAAEVNSRPITYAEIDRQLEVNSAGSQERPTGDDLTIRRLEILRTLVDTEIMLQRAEKLSLMATDADVEAKLNELKTPYTKDQFDRQLQMRKMTIEDLKTQLRRDLSYNKLMNKDITSHISVTDKEIADFYNASKSSFNLPEPQMRLAQIVVTPTPDANIRNLKNDNATTEEAAQTKIKTIEARLHQGDDFAMLAQNFSEDANSAQNGGDVGWIPESALNDKPDLQRLIATLQPGQITGILRSPEGYRIFKLIVREPAGQRELGDPKVQQSIRETLMNRKDQLLRAAYYETARNESKVTNYYAESIVKAQSGK